MKWAAVGFAIIVVIVVIFEIAYFPPFWSTAQQSSAEQDAQGYITMDSDALSREGLTGTVRSTFVQKAFPGCLSSLLKALSHDVNYTRRTGITAANYYGQCECHSQRMADTLVEGDLAEMFDEHRKMTPTVRRKMREAADYCRKKYGLM